MNQFHRWMTGAWNRYKYRFVPWVALNFSEKTAVTEVTSSLPTEVALINELRNCFSHLTDYSTLKDDLTIYEKLYCDNQQILLRTRGFCVAKGPSLIPGAGAGVFLTHGLVEKGEIVCLYPGTVYQPYQPILFQSLRNQFLFRCADGVIVDGNDRALSKIIFRSCAGRDQIGLVRTCDTSWLTPRPVNPLNVGQFVNNGSERNPANVAYQEIDLPLTSFPLRLRKFLPNVNFASVSEDGERDLKLVALVARRRIYAGEELLSSYFTIVPKVKQ